VKRSNGSFAAVTDDLLRDTSALLAWRQANTGGSSTDDDLFVLGAAERALELASNPSALFISLVKHNRRRFITIAQDERAADRLRRHEGHGTIHSPFAAKLISRLAGRMAGVR